MTQQYRHDQPIIIVGMLANKISAAMPDSDSFWECAKMAFEQSAMHRAKTCLLEVQPPVQVEYQPEMCR